MIREFKKSVSDIENKIDKNDENDKNEENKNS